MFGAAVVDPRGGGGGGHQGHVPLHSIIALFSRDVARCSFINSGCSVVKISSVHAASGCSAMNCAKQSSIIAFLPKRSYRYSYLAAMACGLWFIDCGETQSF